MLVSVVLTPESMEHVLGRERDCTVMSVLWEAFRICADTPWCLQEAVCIPIIIVPPARAFRAWELPAISRLLRGKMGWMLTLRRKAGIAHV